MITSTLKHVLILALLLFGTTWNCQAQSEDRKWAVSLSAGSEQYAGDLGGGFFNFDQAFYGFGGLSLSRYLSSHLDLVVGGTLGEIGHIENNSVNRFRARMITLGAQARYSFFKYEDVRFRPYLAAGIGYMYLNNIDGPSNRVTHGAMLPSLSAGLNVKITPQINAFFQETFMYSTSDQVDYETGNLNDSYLQHTIGLSYLFGKAKDSDGDGISDGKDDCPQIAGLEALLGCPDSDGDGIADKDDACPQQAGLEGFAGCPDSDGDGIADKDDACPEVTGLSDFGGCPDSDGDGIADKDDACPQVAGLDALQGCPDTDGDGIADKDDPCPKVAGSRELNGCPDKDGDKIADKDDVCPEVAGIAANKGCPEVKEEEIKVLEEALHGIKFQSGKDVITTSSYTILDNVVDILTRNEAYKLKIEGHTDSQGDNQMNMNLSINRAKAVLDYLVSHSIDTSRLSSAGFGETNPVADNGTSVGRAENRRVELTIEF